MSYCEGSAFTALQLHCLLINSRVNCYPSLQGLLCLLARVFNQLSRNKSVPRVWLFVEHVQQEPGMTGLWGRFAIGQAIGRI